VEDVGAPALNAFALVVALALCPPSVGSEVVRLPAGCALPADAACYSIDGAIALEREAGVGRACEDACARHCDAMVEGEREACAGETELLRGDLDQAIDAQRRAATALDVCAGDLVLADDTLRAMAEAHAAADPVLPGWAWAAAGAGAPLVGLGVCALAGCGEGERWGAAAGGAALVIGAAVLVEW
jgi:hypothetical protein